MSSYTYDLPVVAPGYTGSGANITLLNADALASGYVPKDRGRAGDSIDTGVLAFNGTTKEAGMLYSGSDNPDNTNRLNYDGHIHATKFVGNGSDLTGITAGLSKYTATIGDGSATVINVTHNLGSQSIQAVIKTKTGNAWNGGSYDIIQSKIDAPDAIEIISSNEIAITWASAPPTNAIEVTVFVI